MNKSITGLYEGQLKDRSSFARKVGQIQEVWNQDPEVEIPTFDDIVAGAIERALADDRKEVVLLDVGSGENKLLESLNQVEAEGLNRVQQLIKDNPDLKIRALGITDAPSGELQGMSIPLGEAWLKFKEMHKTEGKIETWLARGNLEQLEQRPRPFHTVRVKNVTTDEIEEVPVALLNLNSDVVIDHEDNEIYLGDDLQPNFRIPVISDMDAYDQREWERQKERYDPDDADQQVIVKNYYYSISARQTLAGFLNQHGINQIDAAFATWSLTYMGPKTFERVLQDTGNMLSPEGVFIGAVYAGDAPGFRRVGQGFTDLSVKRDNIDQQTESNHALRRATNILNTSSSGKEDLEHSTEVIHLATKRKKQRVKDRKSDQTSATTGGALDYVDYTRAVDGLEKVHQRRVMKLKEDILEAQMSETKGFILEKGHQNFIVRKKS